MTKAKIKPIPVFDDPLWLTTEITFEIINNAVYGNNLAKKAMASRNPLITEEHCRHLIKIFDYPVDRGLLVRNKAFPSDLLWELANSENNTLVLGFIATHKNANKETKVLAVLRGAEDVSSWLI